MKIGFCMFPWTTSASNKRLALLQDIKANGYEGVEIPVFEGTPDRGVPGRGDVAWPEMLAAIHKSGCDGWLTIEPLARGLKDLAAATKVWLDFFESPEAFYRDVDRPVRSGWRTVAKA